MNKRHFLASLLLALSFITTGCQSFVKDSSPKAVFTKTVIRSDKDAAANAKQVAIDLKAKLAGQSPKALLVAECYTTRENKEIVRREMDLAFPDVDITTFAVYGMYTEDGVTDRNGLAVIALGGPGFNAQSAITDAIDGKFEATAIAVAKALPLTPTSRGMIVIQDCHSPRNQLFVDGLQKVYGTTFPLAGGSLNKNAGFNWLGYKGSLYTDRAVLLRLDGDFSLIQTGTQANTNDAVIQTAHDIAKDLKDRSDEPAGALFFDCAGRKGKLDDIAEEQQAVKDGLGEDIPFFGIWCAGEVGCAIDSPATPVGRGWHIMGTMIDNAE